MNISEGHVSYKNTLVKIQNLTAQKLNFLWPTIRHKGHGTIYEIQDAFVSHLVYTLKYHDFQKHYHYS